MCSLSSYGTVLLYSDKSWEMVSERTLTTRFRSKITYISILLCTNGDGSYENSLASILNISPGNTEKHWAVLFPLIQIKFPTTTRKHAIKSDWLLKLGSRSICVGNCSVLLPGWVRANVMHLSSGTGTVSWQNRIYYSAGHGSIVYLIKKELTGGGKSLDSPIRNVNRRVFINGDEQLTRWKE